MSPAVLERKLKTIVGPDRYQINVLLRLVETQVLQGRTPRRGKLPGEARIGRERVNRPVVVKHRLRKIVPVQHPENEIQTRSQLPDVITGSHVQPYYSQQTAAVARLLGKAGVEGITHPVPAKVAAEGQVERVLVQHLDETPVRQTKYGNDALGVGDLWAKPPADHHMRIELIAGEELNHIDSGAR